MLCLTKSAHLRRISIKKQRKVAVSALFYREKRRNIWRKALTNYQKGAIIKVINENDYQYR